MNPRRYPLVLFAWLGLALLIVTFYLAGAPIFYDHLQQPGECISCGDQQMTVEIRQSLDALGLSERHYAAMFMLADVIFALVFASVSALLLWKKPADLEVIFCSFSLLAATSILTNIPGELAATHAAWQLPVNIVSFIGGSTLIVFFYLFPVGRFVPAWTGWLSLGWTALVFLDTFFDQAAFSPTNWPLLLNFVAWFGLLGGVIVAQVFRYRRILTAAERQQTKWVFLGLIASFATFVLGSVVFLVLGVGGGSLMGAISVFGWHIGWMFIPVSIAIAILRSRLYDIDILIRRSLIYAGLTASLGLVYFGSVVLLQGLFRGVFRESNQFAIVLSTLAIAALFTPLRGRIQENIDRRFYRRKYNAERVLSAFSSTLRDEVDLDRLTDLILGVVEENMQPQHVSFWFRESHTQGGIRKET